MKGEGPENQPNNASGGERIAWHPAFVEALQMELDAYKDALEFHAEYPLISEPLQIDCIIIKKTKNVSISKNIGAIFRTWNVLEYKSPDDYVSVSDFYKVYGYACLYASFENTPVTDMTVTFIESRYPAKLVNHLRKERGYAVEERGAGVYTVIGDILPIQIINSRRLSAEENLWLKSLSNQLDISGFSRISEEISRLGKAARIAAYVDAIARANTGTVEEVIRMGDVPLRIERALEETGWIARWEARGEARGKENIARNMVALGLPFETIVSATQLDPEKVKALYQQ
jgi:hypothetical protein